MNSVSIEKQIFEIVSRKAGVDIELISLSSDIENDLGITGDDAAELIDLIRKRFHVDITGFVFSKYFHDEPSIFSKMRDVQTFTVGDLIDAALKGKLL